MRFKNAKRLVLLFCALLLLGVLPTAVWAEDSTATMTKGYSLPVSPAYTANFNGKTSKITGIDAHYIGGSVVFCLDPASGSSYGAEYTPASTSALWYSALTAAQRNAIAVALAYGYPNRDYPRAANGDRTQIVLDSERIGATQTIIWEIILGKRSATAPFACSDATLKNSVGSNYATYHQTYTAISAAMAAHKEIPSFAGSSSAAAPSYEMGLNANGSCSISLSDTRGVLSDYSFTGSGLSISANGNVLSVTASSAAAIQNGVLCAATGPSLAVDESIVLVWSPTNSNLQTCGQLQVIPEAAKAYFRLTAPQLGSLQIIKKSESLSSFGQYAPTAGVSFLVTGPNGYRQTATTGTAGTVTLSALPPGSYTVTEQNADVRYITPPPQTVTVSANAAASVTFQNTAKKFRVSLTKQDAGEDNYRTTRSLAGAVYTIYHNGTPIGSLTTAQTGAGISGWLPCQSSGLTIRETAAPPGFQLDTTVYPISANYAGITAEQTTVFLSVSDLPLRGSLQIQKTDAASGASLSGAGYRIYDISGTQVAEAHTDANGLAVFAGLVYGSYTYREFRPPQGYMLDETVYPVTIDKPLIQEGRSNTRRTGTLQVTKQNTDGSALKGAAFLLESSLDAGVTWEAAESKITGKDGMACFTGLRTDAVRYRLTETFAPSGTILQAEPVFEGTLPVEVDNPNTLDSETINGTTYGYTLEITVVNGAPFALPLTGGHVLGWMLPLLAGCTLGVLLVTKRKECN